MPSRISLLGIPVDAVTQDSAVRAITDRLHGDRQCHIVTVNSEMMVESKQSSVFREVLSSSSLNVPDSAGLLWAAKFTGQHLPERVTGVDTVERLLKGLAIEDTVFLLGGRDGVGVRCGLKMEERNSQLNVVGVYEGSPRDEDSEEIIRRVNDAKPRLLLVAYGSPLQELWIARHLSRMPSVRVAIGIGGTFDFLAGKIKRAPKWMQRAGLEWLWRLGKEPRRFGRIWNAVVVFPWLVLRSGR